MVNTENRLKFVVPQLLNFDPYPYGTLDGKQPLVLMVLIILILVFYLSKIAILVV
jgi:hypothetical protein